MNYRTMLRGALALSLGLFVGTAMAVNTTTADIQKYGATFESATNATAGAMNDYAYDIGTNVTKYAVTGGNPSGWFGTAEDESKIIARVDAAGGQALQLNTDAGTLTNKLESSIATDVNDGIAAAGAYIETEAKFVASDTLDAGIVGGTDDTKFAIYAYADENKSPCTTNLVIFHRAVVNDATVYTNHPFAGITIDTEAYTKLRVEMRKLDFADYNEDPEAEPQYQNVFSVKIENTVITSPLAYDDVNGIATTSASGKWFRTVERNTNEDKLLSTIDFKGTGEVDNLSVGIIQETTTYAIDWSASQNVIASNLTDHVQLAAGDTNFENQVQLAFYPTEGQITNINGVTQSPALDVYTYTVNAADTNLTILAGVQSTPATVFSVATVGNATVSGADGVYTISVPLGNGLSSVFVNGVNASAYLTEGQAGSYTLDLTSAGYTGNVNIVVATKKVRTPTGHKWYENPGVIATNLAGKGGQAGPYKFSVGSDFAAISYGNHDATGTGFKLFSIDSLLVGDATPIYTETRADAQSLNINSIRGAAISEALDVALITAYNGGKAYSLPLSANTLEPGVNAFEITNDRGITFDRAYFSADNQYLYTTEVDGGTNTKIAKWAIADGLKGSGQKLTLVTEYTMPSRVRDFAYAVINNKELFYVLKDGTAGVCVYDVAGGTNVQLTAAFTSSGNYGSVAISMASTSTPTLTVLPSTNSGTSDPMAVYQLAADGLSITETLATFTTADLVAAGITAGEYIRTAMPSENDETLYLGYGNNKLYVLQYVEPPTPEPPTVISVALVGDVTVSDSNGTLTFAAGTGSVMSSIYTNGVDTGSTTTFTTNGLTGTVNIVAAAKKVRTAPEHKWWESPQVVGTTTPGLNNEGTYGLRYMNGKDDFVAATGWNANRVVKGFALDDLIAGNAVPIITNTHDNTAGTWGVAISPALNVLLVGADYNGEKLISYPLNASQGTMGVDSFVIETDVDSVHGFQDMEFTADNQYLYALDYETQYVYKFRVLNGLKSEGTNLVRVATYDFGGLISGFTVGQFQGGDVLYAMMRSDGTVKYIDTAAAEPVATQLIAGDADIGGWGDVNVSAVGTGTPRITIFKCKMGYDTRALDVYTLNATGTAVVGNPILSLDAAGLRGIGLPNVNTYGYSGYITEDEETFVFGYDNKLCAIQYVLPTYSIDWTGSTNVTVAIDGLAWDGGTVGTATNGAVVTFTADSGMMITNVAGEAYSPASTYEFTVNGATNIIVLAGVSQPIGRIKPEWAADADTQKFWDWVDYYSVSDYASVDYTTEYLLNTAVNQDPAPEIKITSIEVGATTTTIEVRGTVGRGLVNFANLNGVLNLAVGSSVTALTPKAIPPANLDASVEGVATITIPNGDGCFFRARVDFEAPQASLTAVSE